MNLAPRPGHLLTREAFYHVAVVVGLFLAAIALYRTLGQPAGTLPLTNAPIQIVPAEGDAGYPVDLFCNDPATIVSKSPFPPIDSLYSAQYTLERTTGTVHEQVIVNVYPDPGQQPKAIYGENRDAFVSKDAMACILRKAR